MRGQGGLEQLGVGVVVCQTRHVVLQGVKACRRQTPCLTHASAHDFANAVGFLDEGLRPDQHRPHGASQALAQTK